jgi:hypothetical protein
MRLLLKTGPTIEAAKVIKCSDKVTCRHDVIQPITPVAQKAEWKCVCPAIILHPMGDNSKTGLTVLRHVSSRLS